MKTENLLLIAAALGGAYLLFAKPAVAAGGAGSIAGAPTPAVSTLSGAVTAAGATNPQGTANAQGAASIGLTLENLAGRTLGQLNLPGYSLQTVAQAARAANQGQYAQANVISQAANVAQSPGGGAIAVTDVSTGRRVYATPAVIAMGGYRAGW